MSVQIFLGLTVCLSTGRPGSISLHLPLDQGLSICPLPKSQGWRPRLLGPRPQQLLPRGCVEGVSDLTWADILLLRALSHLIDRVLLVSGPRYSQGSIKPTTPALRCFRSIQARTSRLKQFLVTTVTTADIPGVTADGECGTLLPLF